MNISVSKSVKANASEGSNADGVNDWKDKVVIAKEKNNTDREQAERLGIVWERPDGDNRSAKYILENSKFLQSIPDDENLKKTLKEKVGDYEKDADAAFRAVQLLEHIETFDTNGKVISGKSVGNESLDGVTGSGQVRPNTEAARLKDLGKYGWGHLNGDLGKRAATHKDPKTREQAEDVGIKWVRPESDKRSAQDIIEDTPALKNLDKNSDVKHLLKDQVGDYERDADAAYRAAQVIEHVQRFDEQGKSIVGESAGDGKINGFTSKGEAKNKTEAGRLQDFGKYGFSNLKGKMTDRAKVGDDKNARQEAEKKGIKWERPEDDKRSASDIIKDNPLLANLGNQSSVKDMLKDRVGDYEHDADAAYRAAQVVEHIERFDKDGKVQIGEKVGNKKIDGFEDDRATPNSESGRLQDFGKYGFENLKGKLPDTDGPKKDDKAREKAEALGIEWKRPDNDKRSAEDIIKNNPLLRDLKDESGSKEMLKDRVGDYERDADAAYRAEQVLNHIERFDSKGNIVAGNTVDNDKIDGFTSKNEADPNTEAGRLQDFGKHGFDSLKGKVVDRSKVGKDTKAREKAEDLGIVWERREGDKRTAREIIQDSPVLRDLGNQSGVKEMLKDRVGDYETDADAAFRAAQVLEHIETFDSNGKTQKGDKADNGKIDDFTPDNQARRGTESGRLQDFGKYGFDSLKGKLKERSREGGEKIENEKEARAQAEKLGIDWERPEGDYRTADEILDENPVVKNLTNDEKVKDTLKERVGDFEKDADAAYRAVQVIEHIERFDSDGKSITGKEVGNEKIDGFTNSGQAKHGTEAGRLKDFGKFGFEHLKGNFKDRSEIAADPKAREKAEAHGIVWERPDGDGRTAKEILNDTPALKDLDNKSGVRDMLKDQVGDFEKDADAAYRAAQVIEHVQRFDGEGKSIVGSSAGNNKIDGFKDNGDVKSNTEAERLKNFGKDGFDSLEGKITDRSKVGDDKEARKEAEKLGIKWERPEGDKRSAKEIVNESKTLKDLENHSGVRDMLKDRVGDFDHDADAAYRAVQVIDYIETYSGSGKYNEKSNGKIDGFTNSGEAENNTEAGRLQDFGKYGFSALENEAGKLKDYKKKNPDADAASLKIVEYASIFHENFDSIKKSTGADKFLRVSDLKEFQKKNPNLPDKVNEAIDFWTNPGAFEMLETSVDKMRYPADGLLTKEDIANWIDKEAPKDAAGSSQFLGRAGHGTVVAGVDTDKIGPEIFEKPERYSTEEKAAVVQDLQQAYVLVMMGESGGMWSESHIVKKIKDRAGVDGDPTKVKAEIQSRIDKLTADPKVTKYLEENGSNSIKGLIGDIPGMEGSLEDVYKNDILSGKALDKIWENMSKEKDASKVSAVLEFYNMATATQSLLGKTDSKAIQDAVAKSSIGDDLKKYYVDEIVSGKRLDVMLKELKPEEALSSFTMEIAVLNATLPADVTSKHSEKLEKLVAEKTSEALEDELSFDDLKTAYGVDGTDVLDDKKVLEIYEKVQKESPGLVANEAGKVYTPNEFLALFRGSWDMMRQASKSGTKLGWITGGMFKTGYDKGAMHAVSGFLMAGITIARGVSGGQNMTPEAAANVAIGSIQTTAILIEGGTKALNTYLKERGNVITPGGVRVSVNPSVAQNLTKIENYSKIAGGVAGIAGGVLGIMAGVEQLKTNDKTGAALTLTANSFATLAGIASTVEGTASFISAFSSSTRVMTGLSVFAGAAGAVAAGAGVAAALATIIMVAIQQSEQSSRENDYADLLGDHLAKYEITGKS